MDLTAPHLAPASHEELAGDASPLAQAVGSPETLASLVSLAELVEATRPESPTAIRAFVARYRERLLGPVELPAIQAAYGHAARGEFRELLELDRRLRTTFGASAFAQASRHAGRTQLRRLRPLRDRTLQRYLRAVEAGEAAGWHVVVYGLLLALFSLPLRQGLAHYATRTQQSLIDSAANGTRTSAAECQELREECTRAATPLLASLVAPFPS